MVKKAANKKVVSKKEEAAPVKETPTKAVPEKKEEEAEEAVPLNGISLGSVKSLTVGRNKCGNPMKKGSSKSPHHRGPPISYTKSMERKAG